MATIGMTRRALLLLGAASSGLAGCGTLTRRVAWHLRFLNPDGTPDAGRRIAVLSGYDRASDLVTDSDGRVRVERHETPARMAYDNRRLGQATLEINAPDTLPVSDGIILRRLSLLVEEEGLPFMKTATVDARQIFARLRTSDRPTASLALLRNTLLPRTIQARLPRQPWPFETDPASWNIAVDIIGAFEEDLPSEQMFSQRKQAHGDAPADGTARRTSALLGIMGVSAAVVALRLRRHALPEPA